MLRVPEPLIDPYGRRVTDLRVSITDRCNFRCTYCMPEEGMVWLPRDELLTYEALGLCKEGEAEKFIWDGDNTYGGKFVTNPSGGLLSKGHPLGATGLAQCTELVWHLRGQAEQRQVEGAKVALQHNLGLGGACVVTMYRRD